jgi:hypothetical protein
MMAGDGSFKARLSEAYRHPQYGLRQVPTSFMPQSLKESFTKLLSNIDKNENSRVLNEVKIGLMDEVFLFYKEVCALINENIVSDIVSKFEKPVLMEQSDIPTETTDILTETKKEEKLYKKSRKPHTKKAVKG